MIILTRGNVNFIGGEEARTMRAKRLLRVTSCVFATGSFFIVYVALGNANVGASVVYSSFDVTFSIVLPLICPWLLVTVSPKQQPLRVLL